MHVLDEYVCKGTSARVRSTQTKGPCMCDGAPLSLFASITLSA